MNKFVPFFLIGILLLPFVSAGMLDFLVEQKVVMIPFYPKEAVFDSINVTTLNASDANVGDFNGWGDANFFSSVGISGDLYVDGNITFHGDINVTGDFDINGVILGNDSNFVNIGVSEGIYANRYQGTGDWNIFVESNGNRCVYDVSLGSFACGGNKTIASGAKSIALGQWSNASAAYSGALYGFGSVASAGYSLAGGWESEASSNYAIALGNRCDASGESSVALGVGNDSSGNQSMSWGTSNTAGGIASTAGGSVCTTGGNYSTAIGYVNTANGLASTALGSTSGAYGDYSFVVGKDSKAYGSASAAIGNDVDCFDDNMLCVWDLNVLGDSNSANVGVSNLFCDENVYAENLRFSEWNTAYDHSQDNSQAHSDYLINNGNDTTSGQVQMASLKTNTAYPITGSTFNFQNFQTVKTTMSGGKFLVVPSTTLPNLAFGTDSYNAGIQFAGGGAGMYFVTGGNTIMSLGSGNVASNYEHTMSEGSVHSDNKKAYFGTGKDASIYYDTTDLVINPKEVGSGELKVLGDINSTGSGTFNNLTNYNADSVLVNDLNTDGNAYANFVLGTAWYDNLGGMSLDFTVANTWYKLDMETNNRLNGFAIDDGNFVAEVDGLYRIDYTAEGSGANNHTYVTSILVNDVNQDACISYETMPAAGDIKPMDSFCYLDLQAGDYITLGVLDWSGTETGKIYNYDIAIEWKGKYGLGN